jgi:hypothetical protein
LFWKGEPQKMFRGSWELKPSARWGILAAVFVLAAALRLYHLDEVQVYSDSLSPLLAAAEAWNTGWSPPPNPEADHWLWFTALPALLLSGDLHGFFVLRMLTGALIAPLGAAVAMSAADRNPLLAGGIAGTALALDKGLIDTLVCSFRGYMSPEWIALAILLSVLACRGRRWALPAAFACSAVAAGHHPMAYGACLALLPASLAVFRLEGPRPLIWSAVAFLLFSFFRLLWIAELLQCDRGGLACLSGVALGSSESLAVSELLLRIAADRFATEMGAGAGALLAGCALARRSSLLSCTVLGLVGIVVLGLTISTLRPYHLRIIAAPMVALGAIGLASRPKAGLPIAFFWCASLWWGTPDVIGSPGGIALHDKIGATLRHRPKAWVDQAWRGGIPPFSVSGCALSAWLQGRSKSAFPARPEGLLLLLSEEETGDPVLANGEGWYLQDVGELPAARSKVEALTGEGWSIGGAYDWARAFHPESSIVLEW